MEELLPLLVGIIWLAYTWFNKNQKKKQGKDNQPASEKKAPSILEQLLSGETVPFSKPEPIYEEIEEFETIDPDSYGEKLENYEKKQTSPFLTSEQLSGFSEEGQSVFGDTYNNGINPIIDEETELVFDTWEDEKDFSLRNAVILSEILNAPYIDYK